MRLTKMMLTIFISFLVCFLPLMLVNVIDDDVNVPTLHVVASVLAWMSATINPFIYAFKNRQYQQAFRKVSNSLTCPTSAKVKKSSLHRVEKYILIICLCNFSFCSVVTSPQAADQATEPLPARPVEYLKAEHHNQKLLLLR